MSSREDIGRGRLVYTCRCGWIDRNHSSTTTSRPFVGANNLWNQIVNETGRRSRFPGDQNGFRVSYRQDARLLRQNVGVTKHYLVKAGLSRAIKEQVALAIFQEVSMAFEDFQGWGSFISDSSFSVEDLISNLISFYNAVRPNIDYEGLCQPVSVDASYKVWDTYGAVGSHKNRVFRPIYFDCDECPCQGPFPQELQRITPAEKSGDIRGANQYFRDWLESDDWINGMPPIPRGGL